MLSIKNLSISFRSYTSFFQKQISTPIKDLHLHIKKGEMLALIGASGAGKSLITQALLGTLPPNAHYSGEIVYKDKNLKEKDFAQLRGKEIALIPQSITALNPLISCAKQIERATFLSLGDKELAQEYTEEVFAKYNLSECVKNQYPFEISGGMARRILTATAMGGNAELILADEPTTGLDDRNAKHSLEHLKNLTETGKSVIVITHDLENVLPFADKVAILYMGETVEILDIQSFHEQKMQHPYTKILMDALPQNSFSWKKIPKKTNAIGCKFILLCPKHTQLCSQKEPKFTHIQNTFVRCHHAGNC